MSDRDIDRARMICENEMKGMWGDKRVQTRRWKSCTYEMATYVAFWRAARVPAVNNRYFRTHTPFHCSSGRVCADDRRLFVQLTSPAAMVFCGALISKEGQAHTETHIYFYVVFSCSARHLPVPPRCRQGLTGRVMYFPNSTFPWCCYSY